MSAGLLNSGTDALNVSVDISDCQVSLAQCNTDHLWTRYHLDVITFGGGYTELQNLEGKRGEILRKVRAIGQSLSGLRQSGVCYSYCQGNLANFSLHSTHIIRAHAEELFLSGGQ